MGLLLSLLALVALAYQAFAARALRRHFRAPPAPAAQQPAVTILKPLYGAEPHLADNLASFMEQDYTGTVQLLLATNTPDDPAVEAARTVMARYPAADITLFTGPRLPGANGKMGNCAAALPHARHGIIILSDSDMVVTRDYLTRITAALALSEIGAVSCLYVGRGDAGLWSRLGAAILSTITLPNMVVGLATGMAQPCMGSTIALRRETLDAIGGFVAFRDVLADDHAIGAAVRGLGLKVVIPPMVLTHAGAEASLGQLWRQHLRWAVTVRDLAGSGHYGSLITHALPLALACATVAPRTGGILVAATLALRMAMAARVNRLAPQAPTALWLVPLADLFAFAAFCGSLFARRIDWRGETLTMAPSGQITPEPKRP